MDLKNKPITLEESESGRLHFRKWVGFIFPKKKNMKATKQI